MPKPMYVWSGSAWVSVATEVESLAGFATQSYADNTPGSKLIVPTSVSVGSGSGSVSTQGTVSFSNASSVSLNNCFSSTYTNYRVVFTFTQNTSQGLTTFRLRAGTDATGTNYNYAGYYGGNTSAITRINGATTDAFFIINPVSGAREFITMDITNANVAVPTRIICDAWQGTAQDRFSLGCSHSLSTSYDGFTFYTSAGTLSGTISVYGYKAG
jgi:hypothetical protein